ncbi:hypothetical protein Cantr_10100 [Candida viswanathii]|uniref:Uncharacterized protein n=1 Tax=Candida viswanathii TaxID=5486 RepID=A0A367YC04_9ASCO|nr:hypothetical protein Cantr_10100 [Candida viswanathii]
MSEKIPWDKKDPQNGRGGGQVPSDAPPPYEEIQSQQNPYSRPAPPPPAASEKRLSDEKYSRPAAPPQHQKQYADPLEDPTVLKIKPDKVNITLSPPEHLNPQYQEYLANEPERFRRGEFPTNHNVPLNKGHVNPNNKANRGFPGRSGATYHNAANK